MERRAFLGTVALGLPSLPVLARAQGPTTSVRIGYVTGSPAGAADLIGAFLDGLRALGYDEGRNLTLERRYDETKTETLAGIFAQLIRFNLDVIVVVGPEPRLRAAREATTTIPIVMIAIDYQSSDRFTHHLMTLSARGRTLIPDARAGRAARCSARPGPI